MSLDVDIKTTRGKVIKTIAFPSRIEEVKLYQYIDFTVAYNAFVSWIKTTKAKDLNTLKYRINYMRHVTNILCEFTGDRELVNMQSGDIVKHLKEIYGVDSLNDVDFEASTETLLGLFAYTRNLVLKYKPLSRRKGSFEYKGDKWSVPKIFRSALNGQLVYDSLPAGQAIEIMEVVRILSDRKGDDVDGSIEYTSLLQLMALCARKKGDVFPTTDSEVERFVDERVKYFKDIDMKTALDIQDWVTGWWSSLKKRPSLLLLQPTEKTTFWQV